MQRIDSCLYYNYILAHWYTLDKDTTGIVEAWYSIAIINLLQKKYLQAQAARTIAHWYIPNNKRYKHLEHIYNSVLQFKQRTPPLMQNYSDFHNLPTLSLIGKLCYLQPLLKSEDDYQNYQFKEAKAILQKLLNDMKSKRDTNWFGYAKTNMLMGKCHYTKDDIYSIPYYETAIRIYEAKNIYNSDYADSYRCFLDALWVTGQCEKRDTYFQRLTKINLLGKNRSEYYFIKADFVRFYSPKEALNGYLQAYYTIDESKESRNKLKKKIIYYYTMTDQYEKAIEWFKKTNLENINSLDKIMIGHSYFKLGYISTSQDYIRSALKSYEVDHDLNVLYWVAKYYLGIKQSSKAESYYKLFLQLMLKLYSNDHPRIAISYGALGYFYWFGTADYQKSLEYYHRAVFQLVKGETPKDLYRLPDINKSFDDKDLSLELNNKAEAFYEVAKLKKDKNIRLRELKASLANLELSFTVAYRYKMGLSLDEQRFEFADNIKHRFPYIIKVCNTLHKETGNIFYAKKAFEYAEKSKASLLLSTMRGVNAYKMKMLPESLKKTEDQIWSKTEQCSRYLTEAYKAPKNNHERIDQYELMLSKLRQQQDNLIWIFKTKYPNYYNARYNADVTSVDSIQYKLRPDEALIEYAVENDQLIIFLVTKKDFKVFSDTLGSQFYSDVERYRRVLSEYSFFTSYSKVKFVEYITTAYNLYNKLIKPVEPFVHSKKLLIIPDDVLLQISFETFVTEPFSKNTKFNYRTLPYFFREYNITYNYSGTLHMMNQQHLCYHNTRVLAVAPSYDSLKILPLISNDIPDSLRKLISIEPLTGIYDEVKSVHSFFRGKILMKGDATKENFIKIAGKYSILHLATHGIVNNEYPMHSKLIFTVGNDSIKEGLLNAWEIYNMHINSPLVVLSACNTGFGKLHKGEGTISLARGFFTAGAKSVITTLWAVPDGNSSKLMKYFYANLAAKMSVSDALHQAKLQFLEQNDELDAHPSLWAGYIAVGNTNITFENDTESNKYLYYLASSLLLVSIVVIFRKKIKLKLLKTIR